jgi:transcriptional regulator with XRE-family HTH domain
MLASGWSPELGRRLRAERERLGLSLRDVENLSHGIAEKLQDSDYNIAHTSLGDIENGKWPPTLHRLYTLSVIYGHDYDNLASLCGIPASESLKEHQKIHLPRTYLIGPVPERHRRTVFSAAELRERLRGERTNLVPKMIDPIYGYIGRDDYTLHPIVRPGAFVRIDPRQKKIPIVRWRTDFDRPIFFIELHDRYVCSWCEMHDGRLILVPSHQSNRRTMHMRYPADATIVGRVTGISMDIVEPEETEARA